MAMDYGVIVPQGWRMDLVGIDDPIEAYETMTRVAQGVQKPHIPLLIGGGGEKVTLKLVAQYADACNVGGDVSTIEHKLAVLKQRCEEVGRDYDSIRRTTLINCTIGGTEDEALEKLPGSSRANLETLKKQSLFGTPEMIRRRLLEYEEAGIQEMIIWFPDSARLEPLKMFAEECMRS